MEIPRLWGIFYMRMKKFMLYNGQKEANLHLCFRILSRFTLL